MALTNAGGCAATGPGRASSLNCQVQGAALLKPPSSDAVVCGRFTAALEQALGRSDRFAGRAPAGHAEGDALQVRLDIRSSVVASAQATQTRAGRATTHPEVEVGVSDRDLRLEDLDDLAVEVARQIHVD